jgi:hypothetical protein
MSRANAARSYLLWAALAALSCMPHRASAHAGPEILRLAFKSDDTELVMFSNRGLIFGSRAEHRFRLMCLDSLGISDSERPDMALLSDGRLVLALSAGVGVTQDEGCSWSAVGPFANVMSSALAQDPAQSDTLYLATFAPDNSGIHVSHDAGTSWSLLLERDDNDLVQELRVSPADPAVIYASGQVLSQPGQLQHYFARSQDGGESWEQFDFELDASDSDVALLAVSPTDPMLLLAKSAARDALATDDRLWLSADGGETFDSRFETRLIHAASFHAAGQSIWVAGELGLWRSSDLAERFQKFNGPQWMSCATEHEGELWACGSLGSGQEGIGVFQDWSSPLSARMLMREVMEPVACDATSPAPARCEDAWQNWQSEVLLPMRGGERTAGTSGAAGGLARGEAGSPSDSDAANRGAEAGAGGGTPAAAAAERTRGGGGCATLASPGSSARPPLEKLGALLGLSCALVLIVRQRWHRRTGRMPDRRPR